MSRSIHGILEKLKRDAEQDPLLEDIESLTTNSTVPIKPLELQIAELIKSLPSQLLNRPWSMSEFVARFDGKYRENPHPQMIGQCLKSLGWKSVRKFSKGFDGVRLWLPPDYNND